MFSFKKGRTRLHAITRVDDLGWVKLRLKEGVAITVVGAVINGVRGQ